MPAIVPFIPLIAAGIGAASASKTRKAAEKEAKLARAERGKAKGEFDERIAKYEKSEFVPLDIEALKQEDLFEDLDLSKDVLPAADYAKEQFQQQQANIMQGLRGVAGASGVAGLAQALSIQAKEQSRQTGISIGQQLAQNRKLALQSKMSQQTQERQVLLSNMQGKNAFELDKMATLMGVAGQRTYAAGASLANQQSNIIALQGQQTQLWASAVGGTDWGAVGNSFGGGSGGGGSSTAGDYTMNQYTGGPGPTNLQSTPPGDIYGTGSDRRLKKDISLIGKSPSGLNIYSFKYKDESFGSGTYQGVMSDEIPSHAVIPNQDGYDMVDYSILDVEFKQI